MKLWTEIKNLDRFVESETVIGPKPRARRTDPETSHEAAPSMDASARLQREKILHSLKKARKGLMNRACVALLMTLAACDGGDGSDPGFGPFEGTWAGTYTNNADTTVVQAELQLSQSDDQVLGTIIVAGREASLSGTVTGNRLEASWAYIDVCGGQVTTTADLVDDRLVGTYESVDCEGTTTGAYTLTRQEQGGSTGRTIQPATTLVSASAVARCTPAGAS
jgi:hypothetical protein